MTHFLVIAWSIVTTVFVAALTRHQSNLFELYFGKLPPVPTAIFICASAAVALRYLQKHGFHIYRTSVFRRSAIVAMLFTVPFMVTVTAIDLFFGFPIDTNVPIPSSLLFYPAMGYIAETIFHLVPLAILLAMTTWAFPRWSAKSRALFSLGTAASIECIYQSIFAMREGVSTIAFLVGAQLLLIGIVEMYIFRRYDFASMYVFRLTYYAYWHIGWGYFRLQWLF